MENDKLSLVNRLPSCRSVENFKKLNLVGKGTYGYLLKNI